MPCASRMVAEQPDEPLGRQPEAGGVEDLRADVGVQADELELRVAQHLRDGGLGGTGRQREAELLVLLPGRDVLVGVRLDARA